LATAALAPYITLQESAADVIQRLTEAAERFLASVPPGRQSTQERKALLKAITLAQKSLVEVSRDGL
jgi:hypothetical protein